MLALVEKLTARGPVTRQEVRQATARPAPGRPKPFVFAFLAPTKTFNLRMRFTKVRVDKAEIIDALEAIIRELKAAR